MRSGFPSKKFIPSLTLVNRRQRNESLENIVLHGEFAVFSAIEAKKRYILCLYYAPRGISPSVSHRLDDVKRRWPLVKVLPLPKDSMNRLLGTTKHQGIAVRCSKRRPDSKYAKDWFDMNERAPPTKIQDGVASHVSPIDVSVLLLEDYADQVLGALTRVCIFYQVRSILLIHTTKLSSPETSRSACGSLDYANFIDCEGLCPVSVVKDVALKGYDIAFVPGARFESNVHRTSGLRNVLLVVGKICPSKRQLLEKATLAVNQRSQSKKIQKMGESIASDILCEEVPTRLSEAAELALCLDSLHGQFVQ